MNLKFLIPSDLVDTAKEIGLQNSDIVIVDNIAKISSSTESNTQDRSDDYQAQLLKRERRRLHMRGVKK